MEGPVPGCQTWHPFPSSGMLWARRGQTCMSDTRHATAGTEVTQALPSKMAAACGGFYEGVLYRVCLFYMYVSPPH